MSPNNTKQNIVKNQHYIPEALLRHFTDSKGMFYEVLLERKKIYKTNPNSSMCAKYIYEDDHLEVNTIEKYFSKIENDVIPKIRDIIEFINNRKNGGFEFSLIKNAVEEMLPIFLLFYYRSGALLTEFSSFDSNMKIPSLSRKILNQAYLNELSSTIKNCYNFAIIESNSDFLLSDQYISTAALKIKNQFCSVSNRHIGLKETLILIPISSSFYIIYWHTDTPFFLKRDSINKLKKNELELMNQTIINNSYIKCIGTGEQNLKTILSKFKINSPTQLMGGSSSGPSFGFIKKKEVFFYDIEKQAYEIFIHPTNINEFLKAERNDLCPCNSGKKYKKCHEKIIDRIKIPLLDLKNQINFNAYVIPKAVRIELPISGWTTKLEHGLKVIDKRY